MDRVLSDESILQLLHDDAPWGDLTTSLLIPATASARVEFRARFPMTLCATEESARMFELKGASLDFLQPSGSQLAPGDPILSASGSAQTLLTVWKSAQVIVEWASGIASAARAMVDGAQGIPVACTRKQVPGTKALSIKAVHAGGAVMHRLGVSESILVFAEHRQFFHTCSGKTLFQLKQRAPEHRAIVEVHDIEDAIHWAQSGAEILQLDKFSPADIRLCKTHIEKAGLATRLGIAGGVNPGNIHEFVAAGADFIVTSWPYYASPKDVQVNFIAQ